MTVIDSKQLSELKFDDGTNGMVSRDADGITIKDYYSIEWERIDTPEKILVWVRHLSDKTWMTVPILRKVIGLACHHHRINLPWGC